MASVRDPTSAAGQGQPPSPVQCQAQAQDESSPPPLPPRPILPSAAGGGSYPASYYSQPPFRGYSPPPAPQFYSSGPSTSFYGGGVCPTNFTYPSGRYGGFRSFADSEMVRLAEQNSRNAFRPVESVIFALSSVSQMLETTLNAFHSSFRAIIGVADQFVGLKYNLQRIFATLAVFKFFRWLWRRFLLFAGLAKAQDLAEHAWNAMEFAPPPPADDFLIQPGDVRNVPQSLIGSWSSLAFFAVAIGGPYLIYKLMTKMVCNIENNRRWVSGAQEHYTAVALYDFVAASQQEISLNAGQRLRIAPKELQPPVKGWLLACVDENEIGLVPANYVRILGRVSGTGEGNPQQQQASNNKIPFV